MKPEANMAADPPASRVLHVGCPNLGDQQVFQQLVDEIFERRWFTNNGEVVREFERRLCEYLDVRHCIPVCNATIGLQLACLALELTGEVIVPAFTFVATPHAIRCQGLRPVFADVDRTTHTICPESVQSLISDSTSAILGVHVWGQPCMTERLDDLAEKHGLHVMYDAAHAFGCKHDGKMIGNLGRCEVFSFHATKFFNTFEGGAIATNDDELADRIRKMKNFGFAGPDNVAMLGTNAKMTEICAAMGISVFARLDQILECNRTNYELYKTSLQAISGLRFFTYDHLEQTNWQYIVLEIDERDFGATRDDVFEFLNNHNVRARRYFYPGCHNMEPYCSENSTQKHLDQTDWLCKRALCLPTGSAVTPKDVERICDLLKSSRQ
ncbi:MAG: DegT/DnrJ/EryC1/StrS family aminotransferase [Pirellulaceae bacterium]